MRVARAISRSFRHNLFSRERKLCRQAVAYCCWLPAPRAEAAGRSRRPHEFSGVDPLMLLKTWSSNATIASSGAATARRGTSMRYSLKIVENRTIVDVVECRRLEAYRPGYEAVRDSAKANNVQTKTIKARAIAHTNAKYPRRCCTTSRLRRKTYGLNRRTYRSNDVLEAWQGSLCNCQACRRYRCAQCSMQQPADQQHTSDDNKTR